MLVLITPLPQAKAHPEGHANTLAPLLERTMPAVVNIQTEGVQITKVNPWLRDPFFERFFNFSFPSRSRKVRNVGSGVILDSEKGYIVTNHHVLQGADRISVTLQDGRNMEASIIGRDEESDLALISVEADNLSSVAIAEAGGVRVGDYVVAIGNPFGFSHTVTQGIISGVGRTSVLESKQSLIQTDASINPGNSGGALLNFAGELVGVNTAIYNPSGGGNIGIGFAIPAQTVRRVTDQLIRFGEVRRFVFGIEGQSLNPGLASALSLPDEQQSGVIIMQLQVGSDAHSLGLRPGDVIVSMNNEAVAEAADLIDRYEYFLPDAPVNLVALRDGVQLLLNGKAGQGKPALLQGGSVNPHLDGVVLAEVQIYEGRHAMRGQVVVQEVLENSSPYRFGVRSRDVLSRVNDASVETLEGFSDYTGIKRLLLEFSRGNETYRLVIR